MRRCVSYPFRIFCAIIWFALVPKCRCSHPLLLVISFDGFQYGYLDLPDASLPNLHRLMTNGVRAQWMINGFITKTLPNHYTIETGLYQESHGIVANEMYDPSFNETFEISDIARGKNASKWYDNGVALPVWVANQLQDISRHSGMMMWPGTGIILHNQIPSYSMQYNDSTSWNEKIDIVASWFTNGTDRANCIFLYFNEPDKSGHRYGPHSSEVKKKLSEIDDLIGYLIQKLENVGLFAQLNIMVVSDHGMSEVHQENVIDLNKIINPTWYTPHGSSPVWNLWPADGKTDIIYEQLLDASKLMHFSVYKKEDIPERFHYKNNRRVLPILVVADEGWEITVESKKTGRSVWGSHGYDNELLSMHPIFIAHGPAFKVNYTSRPVEMVDLYPLMLHLLQLPAHSSNGSLSRIKHVLKQEPRIDFSEAWLIGSLSFLGFSIIGATVGVAVTSINRLNLKKAKTGQGKMLVRHTIWKNKKHAVPEEQQELMFSDSSDE